MQFFRGEPNIDDSWKEIFNVEFNKEYFSLIDSTLFKEIEIENVICPSRELIFNAFKLLPFDNVKVVILGQDPYHGFGQAHGLSFSVPKGIRPPPSLINIFNDLESDLGYNIPKHGDLTFWANQGVLLLNSFLTVKLGNPLSHQKIGWELFTDHIIEELSKNQQHLVFILWGKFAQSKSKLIDASKHLIIQSAHPSPLSAYNGFWDSKPFSLANEYLKQNGRQPIDWQIKN